MRVYWAEPGFLLQVRDCEAWEGTGARKLVSLCSSPCQLSAMRLGAVWQEDSWGGLAQGTQAASLGCCCSDDLSICLLCDITLGLSRRFPPPALRAP